MFSVTTGYFFVFVVLLEITVALISETTNKYTQNSTCIQAEAEPTLSQNSCYRLENFTQPFCESHGIKLSEYVFQTPNKQRYYNNRGNAYAQQFQAIFKEIQITCERKTNAIEIYCRNYFPPCDRTTSVFQGKLVCKATCKDFRSINCGEFFDKFMEAYIIRHPDELSLLNCELQPLRNAGESPECWYLNRDLREKGTSYYEDLLLKTDCLYADGVDYNGNISVTESGIPCQSWASQCPHRHTMNTTYPELNQANNYCRNPQHSGERPWCFTTNTTKRWEYCNITTKCVPVDGNYGNWSLTNPCNVTCGQGYETWERTCSNPRPKHGGKNCSRFGNSVNKEICSRKACPINKHGYWVKVSNCSVPCGEGIEIWKLKCDSQSRKNENNCTKYGEIEETRPCRQQACLATQHGWTQQKLAITSGASVTVVIVCVIVMVLLVLRIRRKRRIDEFQPYAYVIFSPNHTCTRRIEAETLYEESSDSIIYENVGDDDGHLPCQGVALYQHYYINTSAPTERHSWYDRMSYFSPVVVNWLRNAWGNVDRNGRNVYDIMQREHGILPYSKLFGTRCNDGEKKKEIRKKRNEQLYSKLERVLEIPHQFGSEQHV